MNKLYFIIVFILFLIPLFSSKGNAQVSDPVIVAGGDISCDNFNADYRSLSCHQKFTAETVSWINPAAVLTLGDHQYPNGTLSEFINYYDPTWGAFKNITYPSVGNHEYSTAGASGYYTYFGSKASPLDESCTENCKGYYSFDIGNWHIISLNSEVDNDAGSVQLAWLEDDLVAHANVCTLAYFHKPRFSSGSTHGSNVGMKPFWDVLYPYGVDVVLNGHDHLYERFFPQDPDGSPDPNGITQFIVGNSGKNLYPFGPPVSTSAFRYNTGYGVLKMTLQPTSYMWELIQDDTNHTVIDSGVANCVGGGIVSSPSPSVFALGDVNHSGEVDLADLLFVYTHYGESSVQPNYFDPAGDAIINLFDANYVIQDWDF